MFRKSLRIKKNWTLQQIYSSKIQKKLIPSDTVEEGLVLQDDFRLEVSETYTKSREKIINVSSDSKGETNSWELFFL